MKKNDTVFFFTLIDLLLQIMFFGVFLFVAYLAVEAKRGASGHTKPDPVPVIDGVEKAAGVPLMELKDFFTKMGPVTKLSRELNTHRAEVIKPDGKAPGKPSCLSTDCLASTTFPGQRQLFLPTTTITNLLTDRLFLYTDPDRSRG
jgi:hypothetical protein